MQLVFDFDGVLADSRQVVLGLINEVALRRGQAPLAASELAALRSGDLIARWRIPFYQVPLYLHRARRQMAARWRQLALFDEAAQAVAWAAGRGVPMAILSSNAPAAIRGFVAHLLPRVAFREIVGNVPLFGKHRALKRLVRRHRWPPHQVVYIGDESRDMQAAARAQVAGVAVGWGKEQPAMLLAAGALWVAQSGEEMIRRLGDLESSGQRRPPAPAR